MSASLAVMLKTARLLTDGPLAALFSDTTFGVVMLVDSSLLWPVQGKTEIEWKDATWRDSRAGASRNDNILGHCRSLIGSSYVRVSSARPSVPSLPRCPLWASSKV